MLISRVLFRVWSRGSDSSNFEEHGGSKEILHIQDQSKLSDSQGSLVLPGASGPPGTTELLTKPFYLGLGFQDSTRVLESRKGVGVFSLHPTVLRFMFIPHLAWGHLGAD